MGEYARLNSMISEHSKRIEELRVEYSQTGDETLLETIYDLEIGIGEIKGALLEMADIDGLDDPYEAFDLVEV